jgi:hypothetical protein
MTRSIVLSAALAAVVVFAGPVATSFSATGDGFGIAEVTDPTSGTSAPAFAPAQRAWWAGVCDLHERDFSIGTDPGTHFSNCIEHPGARSVDESLTETDQVLPPLAPGTEASDDPNTSGPDGWTRLRESSVGPTWRLADVVQAGAHPDGTASSWFTRDPNFVPAIGTYVRAGPDGAPRDIRVSLPPGVIGDPNAVPKCQSEDINSVPSTCPPQSQIGVVTISYSGLTAVSPVYNVEARDGKTAELLVSGTAITTSYSTNTPVVARARTDGDFGVDAFVEDLSAAVSLHSQTFTIWGVPWAKSHDRYRPAAGYCHAERVRDPFGEVSWWAGGSMTVQGLTGGTSLGCSQDPVPYDPSWGPIKAFLSLPTNCTAPDAERDSRIRATTYHGPVVADEGSVAPQLEGCEDIEFASKADFSLAATSSQADGPSGLDVEVAVAQNTQPPFAKRFNADDDDPDSAVSHWKSPAGLATSHLDQTLVEMPVGVSVNPSSATGLEACTNEQIGLRQQGNPPLFNDLDPFDGSTEGGVECPQSSILGDVEVKTHLLDETLTGQLVLGRPEADDIARPGGPNPRNEQELRFRLYIVLRNRQRGLVAKVFGMATADPVTGRIKANFDQNPRVPFDRLSLKLKGGDRGTLALPQRCGSNGWSSEMRPWSGGDPAIDSGTFTTNANCSFGFSPDLLAGLADSQAGAYGSPFSFKFSREDGEHWFRGLTAKLPPGLLAKVRSLPLCTGAQAAAGACPDASRIGTVDAAAGSGDPYVLEKKGDAYLTEGYKGGEYGLMVRVPVEAGPFKGDRALDPIVVRQAIHVDPTTTEVTAISDPFPLIWHGIPVRVREATVRVDRAGFMRAPSSCRAKRISADILSAEGATAGVSQPFAATGCNRLGFKPKLGLRLVGRKQVRTGQHPTLRSVVTQTPNEAGIGRAVVRLPRSLALDVDNAQALCEFEDGTKPDLENHCPRGSIVGRARALSPLLDKPLAGNVYFVKNVRRDPVTGNAIRTLPMIIVALRGEVSVNLRGESDTTENGRLVSTFANVPDAPVDRFNLNIKGGKNGILAVTRTRRSLINICGGLHLAEMDMDGHNGKVHDRSIRVKTPRCLKRPAKTACNTAKQRKTKTCRRKAAKRSLARALRTLAARPT